MEEQVRKIHKRNREDSNSEQEHQHKERMRNKSKKKKQRSDEDALPPHPSSQLQAEEQTHSVDQLREGSPGIGHEENGKEEEKKKNIHKRREEASGNDREILKIEEKKEKKQKKKKGKSNGALEEGSPPKGIVEQPEKDQISREAGEKFEERVRKKEMKRKMKEDSVKQSQNSEWENDPSINGVADVESDGFDSDSRQGETTEKETNKEKKMDKKSKKVTFEDKVFAADQEQASDISNEAVDSGDESSKDLVEEIWGERFTSEEDQILKDAVWTYIKSKGWDEHRGLEKVFDSIKHKDARNCWAEIKLSLPHRPRQAVRYRAHVLLEPGGHLGKWSKEEEDLLKRLQSERGHKWREFTSVLNRQRSSIKEKWRSLKRSGTLKEKGEWTQNELQQLSKMVHESMRMNRLLATKKDKLDHRILRDNITWEKIADTMGTHSHGPCCSKWYYHLQSSLVADGQWANQDDFLLLESLLESGASAEEEVEWENLLEDRSGQVCMTRWKQMVKHLGENRTRQFLDKLDILINRGRWRL
ncbi:hypothetical protein GOP47_0005880 [Adiantum capillus-veneris]|uniref:Uncharacterized protein n=1 Tax=Adiantum capillus-veneris TaxID=13818 RepID=A0A9D4V1X4_ADICA|nr:hypothetical protein GOP47_0005880 [Adiantum capillus-veneris]